MSPSKSSLVKEVVKEELNPIDCKQQKLSAENMIIFPTLMHPYTCSMFGYQNTHLQ